MASQFAPGLRMISAVDVPLLEPLGQVPLIRINGILRYDVLPGGWAFSRYFAYDAPLASADEPRVKRPCLEILAHTDEQLQMRRFVEERIAEAKVMRAAH